MPPLERSLNVLLGLSVLSWAVLGIHRTWMETGGLTWVRTAGSCIHLTAGILFLTRRSMVVEPKIRHILVLLPSCIAGGFAFRLAPPTDAWALVPAEIFVLGAVMVVVSLATLGRNFDLVPAVRGITTSGPFRWIRHPAYLGELVIGFSCFLATRSWAVGVAILALVPCMMLRITAEERLLLQSEIYQQYRDQVRWRLLPGIW